ncbi:MAG: rod shape-determining protein, partial [Acutalibacteraceae bacterium]
MPFENEKEITVKGRNLVDGLPKNVNITPEEIREALSGPVTEIVDTIRLVLEKTPPELAADVIDRGITLSGGGSLLRGLAELISEETGIAARVAENPLDCVAQGTLRRLEMGIPMDYYERKRKYQ